MKVTVVANMATKGNNSIFDFIEWSPLRPRESGEVAI
jgi:hypothetical protein